ncbi:Solute carrier family 39 (Zinc transporter) member 7 [Fasciola hepatica]|uniref:Solute carrier family 39 (Zinc transporter) member 7 n=1 Tax=Fasciola hepatica TaxID=6192 RepID=A0A4E0R7L1_FASHE|nr:Solute carrier family 39 (Zinc transporter) member 7 [Fasciola hepatica]
MRSMLHLSLLPILSCVFGVHSHEHTHVHEHSHAHEPLHLKYLRNANIKLAHMGYTAKRNMRAESAQQLWVESATAVLLISLAPFFVLCLLPDLTKRQALLKIFLAFAAGGLLGDAFLHLIPHAIDRHHEDSIHANKHDHQRHMVVGISIVSGIYFFLCIEKLIRMFQHSPSHNHGHGSENTSQHVSSTPHPTTNDGPQKNKKGKKNHGGDDTQSKQAHHQQTNKIQSQQHQSKKVVKQSSGTELKVAGYLNLAADFTHNFTDGLAIGSSFLLSRTAGMVTTLTVLIHELPHEIGDYAILIQSGCSARKAMFLQLSTAVGAALGASLSLLAAGVGLDSFIMKGNVPLLTDDVITGCILPFTAGGFIYIAMTSVLPDLLVSEHESGSKRSASHWCRRLTQSLAEVIALVAGIGMMAALGLFEQ